MIIGEQKQAQLKGNQHGATKNTDSTATTSTTKKVEKKRGKGMWSLNQSVYTYSNTERAKSEKQTESAVFNEQKKEKGGGVTNH